LLACLPCPTGTTSRRWRRSGSSAGKTRARTGSIRTTPGPLLRAQHVPVSERAGTPGSHPQLHLRRRSRQVRDDEGERRSQPFGFDSFGLPAENAAIKGGVHPRQYTEARIAELKRSSGVWEPSMTGGASCAATTRTT